MSKMKQSTSRYTIVALIVALLACIVTGFLGLIRGMARLGLYTPDSTKPVVDFFFGGNNGIYASLGLIIIGLATYALLEPDKVRRFISGRQARYGSNALVMTLAFVGIIFVVNLLAFQNPKQLADATEDKSHTLAPETRQALKTLPESVTAVAFYSTSLPRDTAEQLLSDFKANSNNKFDYRFVNPDTDPVAAREAGITGDGKIMLVMGDRKEIASFASETELTKSLIRLINPLGRAVYFLTGHGEPDIEAGSEVSFATARQTLESKNYTVNKLNLLTDNKIPENALAIIIAGPLKPISRQEVDLLKKYVDAGGSLVVMEDPTIFTEFGDSLDPLAEYLAKDWGITLNKDVIIDLQSQQPLNAISASFSQHPITQNLSANYVVIMPQARSLNITAQPQGLTQTPLILTGPNSWGEMNFTNAESSQVAFDEGVDIQGPLTLAIAAENSATKGRLVAFGNSVFASDKGFDAYGNGNIFINSVDWVAEQEDLINITPRTPITRTFLPPSQLSLIIILIGVVFIIPGLVVLMGVSAWISRRNRG